MIPVAFFLLQLYGTKSPHLKSVYFIWLPSGTPEFREQTQLSRVSSSHSEHLKWILFPEVNLIRSNGTPMKESHESSCR